MKWLPHFPQKLWGRQRSLNEELRLGRINLFVSKPFTGRPRFLSILSSMLSWCRGLARQLLSDDAFVDWAGQGFGSICMSLNVYVCLSMCLYIYIYIYYIICIHGQYPLEGPPFDILMNLSHSMNTTFIERRAKHHVKYNATWHIWHSMNTCILTETK